MNKNWNMLFLKEEEHVPVSEPLGISISHPLQISGQYFCQASNMVFQYHATGV